MIDPTTRRDEPDRVRAAQATRGLSDDVVDRALAAGVKEAEAARAAAEEVWTETLEAIPNLAADEAPTQGEYRELTSTSNCTEFQGRRPDIRGRGEGPESRVRPVATLNGTLTAVTRAIVAILETHQQADGSVRVPTALKPYLGGLELIKPI